jgi:transposase
MGEITTVGLDLAKQVFQVHAVDAAGEVVLRKALRRSQVTTFFAGLPRCLIGVEACATAHFWARELAALGHEVRLMPPPYVKAYVRRQKNDAADAAAICEAVGRPAMRFVPVKSEAQQAALVMHRVRDLLMRQRTMLINALRGHLAELGIVAPQGPRHVAQLAAMVRDEDAGRVPEPARRVLLVLVEQLEDLAGRLALLMRELLARHRSSPTSRRLATIPGIGPVTASTLAATVGDPAAFRHGRAFAAWLGLVPRQSSSGGKARLGRISKRGDSDLRRLLITGAQAVLRWPRAVDANPWLKALLARRPRLVAAVALANKLARIAPRPAVAGRSVETDRPRCGRWAVLRHETEFRPVTA